jgi:hypothetical protein
MSFNNWKARLAGETVPAFVTPTAEDEGYYRKPITQKKLGANGKTNGQNETIGWVPCAYFLDGTSLVCLLGGREVESEDESLWSWVVRNPISYETYKAVAEDGKPWPDTAPPVMLSENVGAVPVEKPKEPETLEEHQARINLLIEALTDAKVGTDEEANAVNGSINRLAEARLAADKAGKSVYKPFFDRYKAAFNIWTPMVSAAEAEEKRATRLILVYRESVRLRLEKEAKEAAEKAAAEAEAQQRAADRAIASGTEPDSGLVEWAEDQEEILLPPPEEPEPVKQPAPLAPTHGKRKVREQMQTFVEITDIDKVFVYFKETAEIKAVLHTLALAAVKAGRDVPGITKREGLA